MTYITVRSNEKPMTKAPSNPSVDRGGAGQQKTLPSRDRFAALSKAFACANQKWAHCVSAIRSFKTPRIDWQSLFDRVWSTFGRGTADPASTQSDRSQRAMTGTSYACAHPATVAKVKHLREEFNEWQKDFPLQSRERSRLGMTALERELMTLERARGGVQPDHVSAFERELGARMASGQVFNAFMEIEAEVKTLSGMHAIHGLPTDTAQWASLNEAMQQGELNPTLNDVEISDVKAKLEAVREPYRAHVRRFLGYTKPDA